MLLRGLEGYNCQIRPSWNAMAVDRIKIDEPGIFPSN